MNVVVGLERSDHVQNALSFGHDEQPICDTLAMAKFGPHCLHAVESLPFHAPS